MWILTLVIALLLGAITWALAHRLADRRRTLVALERALVDYLVLEQNGRIKHAALLEQQKIVEKSVDTGADSAELVHKTVADVAFGIMDNIDATKDVSKFARGLHDGIADSVYATVRTSNKEIGKLTKELLKIKGNYDTVKRRQQAARTGVPGKPSKQTAGAGGKAAGPEPQEKRKDSDE